MYIIFNYSSSVRDIFHVYIVYGHANDFPVYFSSYLCILEHVASGFDYFWLFQTMVSFYLFAYCLFTRMELSILIKPQFKYLCFYFIWILFSSLNFHLCCMYLFYFKNTVSKGQKFTNFIIKLLLLLQLYQNPLGSSFHYISLNCYLRAK